MQTPFDFEALIIDDNAASRQVAAALLNAHGIRSDEATDGVAGLAIMRGMKYGLVLLDISMPGLDGVRVCRRLREQPAMQDVYIVAYTAHGSAAQNKQFADRGFDALLVKPVTLRSLTEAIAPLLTRSA